MATYVLIHGAASDSWYWHLVSAELRALGHDVVAPDLPCDDDRADLLEYARAVVAAIGDRTDLVVVGQSMGGFTAPIVCTQVRVDLLVLVAAMVPMPWELLGDWWDNTGWERARREKAMRDGRHLNGLDPLQDFFHDVPLDVTAAAVARGERNQSYTPFTKPWPLDAWPDVPTRFLLCRDDRFLPADLQRSVVRARLRITPDEMDGGHLPALARPAELVRRLEAYRAGILPSTARAG